MRIIWTEIRAHLLSRQLRGKKKKGQGSGRGWDRGRKKETRLYKAQQIELISKPRWIQTLEQKTFVECC